MQHQAPFFAKLASTCMLSQHTFEDREVLLNTSCRAKRKPQTDKAMSQARHNEIVPSCDCLVVFSEQRAAKK
jgi:hypothetical protein